MQQGMTSWAKGWLASSKSILTNSKELGLIILEKNVKTGDPNSCIWAKNIAKV